MRGAFQIDDLKGTKMNAAQKTPALPVSAATNVSSLALLQATFPRKISLSAHDVAACCPFTTSSIRTMNCRGVFPISSTSNGGRRHYDIRDVAAYLDSLRTPKPKRGAPTKAERLARLEGGAA